MRGTILARLAPAVIGLAVLLLLFGRHGGREAWADDPHAGLNFFLSADVPGGSSVDCDTDADSAAGANCAAPLGATFTVKMHLGPLPATGDTNLAATGIDAAEYYLTFAGVTASEQKTTTFMSTDLPPSPTRQGCEVTGAVYGVMYDAYLCAVADAPIPDPNIMQTDLNDSDLGPGVLVTQVFNCAATGTVSLIHGEYITDVYVSPDLHTEATSGSETLTVNCGGGTPAGTGVIVSPGGGVTVVFESVTSGGDTMVTTSTTGPPPPPGLEIVGLGGQPTYYDVSTTATFSGQVTVCINYDQSQVAGPESDLKLHHYVGTGFVDVTQSVDPANDNICGKTTTLSVFAVMEPAGAVGGIADLPEVDGAPLATSGSSGPSVGQLAGVAAAAGTGVIMLGAIAWDARRRRS